MPYVGRRLRIIAASLPLPRLSLDYLRDAYTAQLLRNGSHSCEPFRATAASTIDSIRAMAKAPLRRWPLCSDVISQDREEERNKRISIRGVVQPRGMLRVFTIARSINRKARSNSAAMSGRALVDRLITCLVLWGPRILGRQHAMLGL
jgi:hypothetical protein